MAPQSIRVSAASPSSLEVTWNTPPLETQNGLIQGYKVTQENTHTPKCVHTKNAFWQTHTDTKLYIITSCDRKPDSRVWISWLPVLETFYSPTTFRYSLVKRQWENEVRARIWISFIGSSIPFQLLSPPELPCPNPPPLLILQTQGYLSHFRHIDFCRRSGGMEKTEGKVIFAEWRNKMSKWSL